VDRNFRAPLSWPSSAGGDDEPLSPFETLFPSSQMRDLGGKDKRHTSIGTIGPSILFRGQFERRRA
jgi:hypothetical protein